MTFEYKSFVGGEDNAENLLMEDQGRQSKSSPFLNNKIIDRMDRS